MLTEAGIRLHDFCGACIDNSQTASPRGARSTLTWAGHMKRVGVGRHVENEEKMKSLCCSLQERKEQKRGEKWKTMPMIGRRVVNMSLSDNIIWILFGYWKLEIGNWILDIGYWNLEVTTWTRKWGCFIILTLISAAYPSGRGLFFSSTSSKSSNYNYWMRMRYLHLHYTLLLLSFGFCRYSLIFISVTQFSFFEMLPFHFCDSFLVTLLPDRYSLLALKKLKCWPNHYYQLTIPFRVQRLDSSWESIS